ncbi:MAG TPA: hypothetical protein VL523_17645 [Terriglobia bacterium]|nr:hypothetical protein [Terriglobia bacterium]
MKTPERNVSPTNVGLAVFLALAGTVTSQSMAVAQQPVPPGELASGSGYVEEATGARVANGFIHLTYANGDTKTVNLGDDGTFPTCEVCGNCATSSAAVLPVADNRLSHRFAGVLSRATSDSPGPSAPLPDMTQAITYETAMAEILKLRFPDKDRKPGWQVFIESVGGAAAITVVIGGLLGGLLTAFVQRKWKEREILLDQLDSRKRSQLQRDQQYLDGEMKVVRDILEFITSSSVAAEDLVQIASKRFQVGEKPSASLLEYREQARSAFNAATRSWRSQREILGVTLGSYHGEESAVFRAWSRARQATTNLQKAAQAFYDRYYDSGQKPVPENEIASACLAERNEMDAALVEFSQALFTFRKHTTEDSDVFSHAEAPVGSA